MYHKSILLCHHVKQIQYSLPKSTPLHKHLCIFTIVNSCYHTTIIGKPVFYSTVLLGLSMPMQPLIFSFIPSQKWMNLVIVIMCYYSTSNTVDASLPGNWQVYIERGVQFIYTRSLVYNSNIKQSILTISFRF